MRSVPAIAVVSPCIGWKHACPDADRLAREAVRVALAIGVTTTGLASPARVELCIVLADDTEQQRLNSLFRGQDTPTNVLAFPAWEPGMRAAPGAPLLLGDIVLAFETVAREAAEQSKPFTDHLRHLIVHGVLHLLGYDHQTAGAASIMEALERVILAKLGVPDPYHDQTPHPAISASVCA
jgi:probable rRNA maturation factor